MKETLKVRMARLVAIIEDIREEYREIDPMEYGDRIYIAAYHRKEQSSENNRFIVSSRGDFKMFDNREFVEKCEVDYVILI